MRMLSFILFTACLSAHAAGSAQTVTLSGKDMTLKQVFAAIKKQTGYVVFSKEGLLSDAKSVSLTVYDMPLRDLLDAVLRDQPLDYVIKGGKTIILSRRSSKQPVLFPHYSMTPQPVSGRVVDSSGNPIQGASIRLMPGNKGATSGADGSFVIANVAPGDYKLEVSYIGFETLKRKIAVADGDPAAIGAIVLQVSTSALEEVTISTGYFSSTKAKSTMNITRVEGKDIENQPVTSLMNALVGRVPGLDITPSSGIPGRAPDIEIRGNNSLRTGASLPLYVIDGVQMDARSFGSIAGGLSSGGYDPLASISPADIESIEVLKDAAATSIYGSRGANGVIRIITKQAKGSKENTAFDVNLYKGAGKMVNRMELLNREQYLAMRHEAFRNAGTSPGVFDHDLNGNWDTTRNTDWQDLLLGGTAHVTDLQGSFNGGNELTSFRLGGGYHKETSIAPGDDFGFQRLSANLSFHHLSRNRRMEISAGINFGHTRDRSINGITLLGASFMLPPVAPALYNDDGSLNWQEYGSPDPTHSWDNPLAELLRKLDISSNSIVANSSASYEFLPGLKFKTLLTLSKFDNDETRTNPSAAFPPSFRAFLPPEMYFVNNDRTSLMVEPQLIYNRLIKNHHLNVLAGLSYQQSRAIHRSINATGYPSDALLGSIRGATSLYYYVDDNSQYKYISAYLHLGYDFRGKYLLNITGRRDGSSRFGPGKRYGNFGAVGAGWIFSEEALIRDRFSFISFGKIRGSYGITGNDQIGDYQFLDTYSILTTGYQNGVGTIPYALFNPDFAWESTRKLEVALELAFARNRISVEGAWYRNISSNQLVQYSLSEATGFPNVLANFDAVIENTGWEFQVTTKNIATEKLRWTTSFNLTIPRNKLVKFENIESSLSYSSRYKIGEPLSIQRLYTYKGIDPVTGLFMLEDVDANGVYNDKDRRFSSALGRVAYYGLNNVINYKNVELSFLLQISNNPISNILFSQQPGGLSNQPVEVLDRWQKPGDVAKYQKFQPSYDLSYTRINSSDYGTKDASFVRLKTLSLACPLSMKFLEKAKIHAAHVFIQGQNLFTITRFSGFDPETGNAMPPLKMLSLGLQFKL